MTTHARQKIRKAFESLLVAGSHPEWKGVLLSRIPSKRQSWNYLMVFAEVDTTDSQSENDPAIYGREVLITVIGMLRLPGSGDTVTIEDQMDAMALALENRLTFAQLIAELPQVQYLTMVSSQLELVANETDDAIDHAELTTSWKVGYYTQEGAAETLQ